MKPQTLTRLMPHEELAALVEREYQRIGTKPARALPSGTDLLALIPKGAAPVAAPSPSGGTVSASHASSAPAATQEQDP